MRPRRLLRVVPLFVLALAIGWCVSIQPTVLYEGESQFSTIRVVEQRSGLRELYQGEGRGRQTALDLSRPLHLELPYTRTTMVGLGLVPPNSRVLFVGLGGGAMPSFTRRVRPQMLVEVVELDPAVVDVAREWFGLGPDSLMTVHVGDGRAFIEGAPPYSWDLIVLDAFSGSEIPYALATVEFLEAVASGLDENGVVVSNLHNTSPDYGAMVATYRHVFPHVALLKVPFRSQVILLASEHRSLERSVLVAAAERLTDDVSLSFDLPSLVSRHMHSPSSYGETVLRDRR